jgi:hypothetical protein
MRWNMSPFAVAQCTSSIQGKLMFEGKLVAAAIETSGAIEGHFDYVFSGSGKDRTVTASAKRRGDAEPRTVEVALKDVETSNGMWKKQPDQQLVYSANRIWGRRWTPAVMLGVYSREEFDADQDSSPIHLEPQPRRETAPQLAAPAAAPIPATSASEKIQAGVAALIARLDNADTMAAADAILAEPKVGAQRQWLAANASNMAQEVEDAITATVTRLTGDADPFPTEEAA